jgi:Raf kinase inhibitor-like YbhB/YbcL family protein
MHRMLRVLGLSLGLAVSMTGAQAAGDSFKLSSPDVKPRAMIDNKYVFDQFGCKGGNVSPALSWSGAPEGTKSFVLTVYDPDAPTGSGFWHWVMFNIPPTVTSLPQGAGTPGKEPQGATQIQNDYGTVGYGGPCPPPGKPHRYQFTVYALKTDKLDLKSDVHAAVVGFMTHMNTIGKATFTARYGVQ